MIQTGGAKYTHDTNGGMRNTPMIQTGGAKYTHDTNGGVRNTPMIQTGGAKYTHDTNGGVRNTPMIQTGGGAKCTHDTNSMQHITAYARFNRAHQICGKAPLRPPLSQNISDGSPHNII